MTLSTVIKVYVILQVFLVFRTTGFASTCFHKAFHRNILMVSLPSGIPQESSSSSSSTSQLLDVSLIAQRVFEKDQRPVILFDGVCNLCNNAVNLALDWDPNGKLRFSALQSQVGRALLEANHRRPDDISSIVVVTKHGAYIKSDAILKIAEELTPKGVLPLKPVATLGRYLVPRFLRDIIYDGVANNRYNVLGKRDQCRFDADGKFEDRFVDDSLAFK